MIRIPHGIEAGSASLHQRLEARAWNPILTARTLLPGGGVGDIPTGVRGAAPYFGRMSTPLRIHTLPGGMLILVGGELGDFWLEGYRQVEARIGFENRNGPTVKPSEALAARRFVTMVDLVESLNRELAK